MNSFTPECADEAQVEVERGAVTEARKILGKKQAGWKCLWNYFLCLWEELRTAHLTALPDTTCFFCLCMPLRHLFGISCSRMPLRAELSQCAAGVNTHLRWYEYASLLCWFKCLTRVIHSEPLMTHKSVWRLCITAGSLSYWAAFHHFSMGRHAERYRREKLKRQNSHTQRFHSQSVVSVWATMEEEGEEGGRGGLFHEWFPINKTNSHRHAQMLLIIARIFWAVYLIFSHWSSNVQQCEVPLSSFTTCWKCQGAFTPLINFSLKLPRHLAAPPHGDAALPSRRTFECRHPVTKDHTFHFPAPAPLEKLLASHTGRLLRGTDADFSVFLQQTFFFSFPTSLSWLVLCRGDCVAGTSITC